MIEAPAPGEVGKEGDTVTLKCLAYGSPAPQFTWKPSGKEVHYTLENKENTQKHQIDAEYS